MQNSFMPMQTTQISYDSGLTGWKGLVLGIFNGLFSGGGIGRAQCAGGYAGYGQSQVNELANLKTLGPGWSIVQDPNGGYTATRAGYESISGNYNTVKDHIMNSNKSTTTNNETKTDNSKTDTSKTNNNTTTKNNTKTEPQGAYDSPGGNDWSNAQTSDLANGKKIAIKDHVVGSSSEESGTLSVSDKKTESGYPETISFGNRSFKFEKIDNGIAIYKSTNGNCQSYRLEKKADGSLGLNQWYGDEKLGAGRTNWGINTKLHMPEGWGRAGDKVTNDVKQCKNAQEVINKMGLTGVNADQLAYYNPSVFNADGSVKNGAVWTKLDIPSAAK
jgi:hypothetical protein